MRSKARLTITMAHDLLDQIDRMIDEKEVRNRSHAIEVLIRQSLMPKVTTAAILAGGSLGEDELPPLLPINGRRLIHITIGHLINHGIRRIFILAGKNERRIREVVGEGSSYDAVLNYVKEGKEWGTAGAVKLIEHQIGAEPLLVLHGDILTDIDLAGFIQFHKQEGRMATIAVKPRNAEKRYGKVMLEGNRITEFLDSNQSEGISIVNTGVYLLQPEALRLIRKGKPAYFESDLFPQLAEIDELSAFIFQGVWFDISQESSYASAKKRWKQRE